MEGTDQGRAGRVVPGSIGFLDADGRFIKFRILSPDPRVAIPMKNLRTVFRIGFAPLIGALMLAWAGGCGPARPGVICVMQNPETGQRVERNKEIWYKVPAGYDEQKHIEQWKEEQRRKGFTVTVEARD